MVLREALGFGAFFWRDGRGGSEIWEGLAVFGDCVRQVLLDDVLLFRFYGECGAFFNILFGLCYASYVLKVVFVSSK